MALQWRSGELDSGHNHSKVGFAHTLHHFYRYLCTHTPTHTRVNRAAHPRAGRRSTSDVGGELASHCSHDGGEGQTHPSSTSNLKRTHFSIAAERTSSIVFSSLPPTTPSSRALENWTVGTTIVKLDLPIPSTTSIDTYACTPPPTLVSIELPIHEQADDRLAT